MYACYIAVHCPSTEISRDKPLPDLQTIISLTCVLVSNYSTEYGVQECKTVSCTAIQDCSWNVSIPLLSVGLLHLRILYTEHTATKQLILFHLICSQANNGLVLCLSSLKD